MSQNKLARKLENPDWSFFWQRFFRIFTLGLYRYESRRKHLKKHCQQLLRGVTTINNQFRTRYK